MAKKYMKFIPNLLTVLRAIGAVVVIAIMLLCDFENSWSLAWAGALFLICSLTDMADGMLARKYNVVSVFGKFVDPIADKFLVIGVMVAFLAIDPSDRAIMATCIIITLAREFVVTSIRLLSMERGIVVAANIWGKSKTVVQIVALCIYFVAFSCRYSFFGHYAMIIAAIVTFISGVVYLKDFIKMFDKA